MHPQGMKQFENYRNSVTRLSTALTMSGALHWEASRRQVRLRRQLLAVRA